LRVPINAETPWVEDGFREPPLINGFQPVFKAIDAQKVGGQSNQGAFFHMKFVDGPVLPMVPSFPVNPERTEGTGPMGIWDFGQRREKGRIDEELMDTD
jgi:hypothetical protein